jgi:predicted kinase
LDVGRQLVVQMHGEPGSGKSAVARALGARLGAVVLDKDVIKSALLDADLTDPDAGYASFGVLFDVAADLLRQGHSVVLDTPVYWPMVAERSCAVAEGADAAYALIRCVCEDGGELARRQPTRKSLKSQPRTPVGPRVGTIEPSHPRLTLNTTRPLDELVDEALAYITHVTPQPPLHDMERGSHAPTPLTTDDQRPATAPR